MEFPFQQYLRVVSVSYLFSGITQCYFLKMKIEGNASKCVQISVVTLLLDMFADTFLIYGLCGVPKFGAVGSAYSTVAVEFIALLWCVGHSTKKSEINPSLKTFIWFDKDIFKSFIKIIVPTLFSSLAWGMSIAAHSVIMGHLGTDAAAASSITSVVQELITCACRGIASGAGIIIGKFLGQ